MAPKNTIEVDSIMLKAQKIFLFVAGTCSLVACASASRADESVVQVIRTSPIVEETRVVDTANPVTTTTTTTTVKKEIVADPGVPGTVVERTVVTGSGVVPLTITDARAILQTVDQRRSELDKRIVDARSASTLSEAQARELRQELDRIGAEVTYLKGQSNPSLVRAIVLGQDLDVLSSRFRTVLPSTTVFVPIIEGSHFTIFNGRTIQLDDLAVRRIELENKILSRQASGKITWEQANHLRSNLNAVAAKEDAFRADGDLTFKESKIIYQDMDKVANELDNMSI